MILKDATIQQMGVFLKENNWLSAEEQLISTSIPGSGNMNYVVRVHTNLRTFILKQSMPYVQKYPSVVAPQERIITEFLFYKTISGNSGVQQHMPEIIGLDEENYILAMQDAGQMQDATALYHNPDLLNAEKITRLVDFLNNLHRSSETEKPVFENEKMKMLNALHIFDFPFKEENGFNLDTVQDGLQAAAMPYKQNEALKKKMQILKRIYLSDGNFLLHGDYYPGSWLINERRVKIIDPEFCFYGFNEFDLSVMVAHLKMAKCSKEIIDHAISSYAISCDNKLLYAFTGIEILRRLTGLAQLPLSLSLKEKQVLMEEAREQILHYNPEK